jgi:hypothetical protein
VPEPGRNSVPAGAVALSWYQSVRKKLLILKELTVDGIFQKQPLPLTFKFFREREGVCVKFIRH